MKRFLAKVLLFAGGLGALYLLLQLLYPLESRTFRAWEQLSTYDLEPMPFYPNRQLQTIEEGDLGHDTPYGVAKAVAWQIDDYGYRAQPSPTQAYDIVIVGDSNVVGSGLTQMKTIAALLAAETGLRVYPLAPATMADFLTDARFQEAPPDLVIFMKIERNLNRIPMLEQPIGSAYAARRPFTPVQILQDQVRKDLAALSRSLLGGADVDRLIVDEASGMVFSPATIQPRTWDQAQLDGLGAALAQYEAQLMTQGSDFLFVPIPDKETIHFDLIPAAARGEMTASARQEVLAELIAAKPVPTIDLLALFTQAAADGTPLYQMDDTHWNETAVALTAKAIAQVIE